MEFHHLGKVICSSRERMNVIEALIVDLKAIKPREKFQTVLEVVPPDVDVDVAGPSKDRDEAPVADVEEIPHIFTNLSSSTSLPSVNIAGTSKQFCASADVLGVVPRDVPIVTPDGPAVPMADVCMEEVDFDTVDVPVLSYERGTGENDASVEPVPENVPHTTGVDANSVVVDAINDVLSFLEKDLSTSSATVHDFPKDDDVCP